MVVKLYVRLHKIKLDETIFILNKKEQELFYNSLDEMDANFFNHYNAIFTGDDKQRVLIIDIDKSYINNSDYEYYQKRITPILKQQIRIKKLKKIISK